MGGRHLKVEIQYKDSKGIVEVEIRHEDLRAAGEELEMVIQRGQLGRETMADAAEMVAMVARSLVPLVHDLQRPRIGLALVCYPGGVQLYNK